jgi:putative transposase
VQSAVPGRIQISARVRPSGVVNVSATLRTLAIGGIAERKAMIDRAHDLPVSKQAGVLRISRGSVYYRPRPVPEAELAIMRRLDRLHLEFPFAGSRMLRGLLAAEGCKIGRRHVKTLMRRMGIEALYRRPRTSKRW